MHALVAWVLFPLVALAVCTGVGLLAERIARADLHPAAIPPLGFATAIVLLGPLFATGAGGAAGSATLLAATVAGFVLGRHTLTRLRPGPGAAASSAVYALYIAPIALSGTVGFLGYNLLNDTAIHLALVDWIGDHGSRWIAQPPSSYASAIHEYVGSDYPLGSHELLAALRPLTGLDAALLYQPFLAVSAGLGAAALFALLRDVRLSPLVAGLSAFAALGSQLVFSFSLQGGIKEITFITCLAAAAAIGRDVRLMALPAAALYAIYGVYALPWIAALALLVIVLRRPAVGAFATGAAVFIAAIAVTVPGSIHYWRHGHSVITSGSELGPLAGPIKWFQVAGIWLTGDYRFTPATIAWITYALIAGALALALLGALRRRPLLLLLGPALIAALVTAPFSSPYIDAKLLAVLSPAVVAATCVGIATLRPRGLAIGAAVVLGGALLVSDALAYRIALVAPMNRLDELAAIDKRFAGRGPILVNEFEQYLKHFMRRSRGSEPYEKWTQAYAVLRRPHPVPGHYVDLDEFTTAYVEQWPLIALRRSPVADRPPSNYSLAYRGRWYDVWRRAGPPPLRHVPAPSCASIRALGAQHPLVAARRAPLGVYDIASASLPPGWSRDPADPHMLVTAKGGFVVASGQSGAPAVMWLRGTAFRDDELSIDGRRVGTARGLQQPQQWLRVGPVSAGPAGAHRVELLRPQRSLRPGDGQADHIGPVVVAPDAPARLVRTRAGHAGVLCGRALQWVDVLR